MKPELDGWTKDGRVGGRPRYVHHSKIVVEYDCMRWAWQIIGGPRDSECYAALWFALHEALRP
jgi:hypothetical protein